MKKDIIRKKIMKVRMQMATSTKEFHKVRMAIKNSSKKML